MHQRRCTVLDRCPSNPLTSARSGRVIPVKDVVREVVGDLACTGVSHGEVERPATSPAAAAPTARLPPLSTPAGARDGFPARPAMRQHTPAASPPCSQKGTSQSSLSPQCSPTVTPSLIDDPFAGRSTTPSVVDGVDENPSGSGPSGWTPDGQSSFTARTATAASKWFSSGRQHVQRHVALRDDDLSPLMTVGANMVLSPKSSGTPRSAARTTTVKLSGGDSPRRASVV